MRGMKCEVTKDLLTLYVEDMCSEVSKAELEIHIQECPECAKALEELKKELGSEEAVIKTDYSAENAAALKPMKKVKKRLFRRMAVSVALGLVVIFMLYCIGSLSYGQMTNRGMSFSAIADAIKLKSVCESLAEGDTQALLDVVAFRIEDIYQVKYEGSLYESFENYKESIKKSMDEAYEYYFEGKDIEVRIEELWLTPYDENTADNMATTAITIGFYEGENLVYTMDFGKVSPKKFVVYEETKENEPNFAANLLPYEDVILEICLRHATTRQYDQLVAGKEQERYGSGFVLGIEKVGTEEEKKAYSEAMRERVTKLYMDKWYFKEVFFAPEEFDTEKNRWIYKVWFQVEDQNTGSIAIMEQRFTYYNSNLYAIEEEVPAIMATNGEIPDEIEQQLLEMFR